MAINEKISIILNELAGNKIADEQKVEELIIAIRNSNHIFLAGAGRSGIAIKAFANRLLHLGFSVSIVGDTCSPHSQNGDLLIVGSGSGETESLKSLSDKAKKNGLKVALLTTSKDSYIAGKSDIVILIPGSRKDSNDSIQPMGSAFEQFCFITYDGIVLELMEKMGEDGQSMYKRHSDFE